MKHKLLVLLVGLGICIGVSIQEDLIEVNTTKEYIIVPSLAVDNKFCGTIVFNVCEVNNIFVALLSGDIVDTLQYEIALGKNLVDSYIRKGNENSSIAHYSSTNICISNCCDFGISWKNGTVTVWQVSPHWKMESTRQPLITVNSIAVKSSGVPTIWHFPKKVMIPEECEIATTESITTTMVTVSATTNSTGNINQASKVCACPCSVVGENKWQFLDNLNLTIDEIKILMKDELESLKSNLTVNKKNTSAFLRTKTSAVDNRPVSQSLGAVGVIALILVAVLLMGSDFVNVIKMVNYRFRCKNKRK